MEAQHRKVANVLNEGLRYTIPPYQRPYSWKAKNVQQMLDDVWDGYERREKEYFIGSLITIVKERDRCYEVVDGQQRMTTLTLILARLRDRIVDEGVKANLDNRILPRDVFSGQLEEPRLALRISEQALFRQSILERNRQLPNERDGLSEPQRLLVGNAEVIDEFLESRTEEQLKGFAGYILNNVYVVFVTNDSWQSAFRLFTVLNDRGVDLSNADLIKNSLFELVNEDRGSQIEQMWLELEELVGVESLDKFFSHFRSFVLGPKTKEALNEEIRKIIREKFKDDPFLFLVAATDAARSYDRVREGTNFDDSIRALNSLKRVDYEDWYPPLLAYLSHPAPAMTEREFVELLEKVTIQNWVRRLGSTARTTVYSNLIRALRDETPSAEDIRQIFRVHAKNNEFLDLLNRELYGQPFDQAVLLRLNEALQDHSVTHSYDKRLSIEHVLPQDLADAYWLERFTVEQHAQWKHRLGNLTLLAGNKNSKARNYSFDKKKEAYLAKNTKSSFDLTKAICDEEHWTVETLVARQNRMLKLAEETWAIQ